MMSILMTMPVFRILFTFNNPQDGLKLVSNPCIEVLADKETPNAYTPIQRSRLEAIKERAGKFS